MQKKLALLLPLLVLALLVASSCKASKSKGGKKTRRNNCDEPTLTSIEPSCGPLEGGTAVTLRGTQLVDANVDSIAIEFLVGAARNRVPDASVSFSVADPGTVHCVTPPSTAPGLATIVLTKFCTRGPRPWVTSLPLAFEYLAIANPVIESVKPNHGCYKGVSRVEITGSNFAALSEVYFEYETGDPETGDEITVRAPARGVIYHAATSAGVGTPAREAYLEAITPSAPAGSKARVIVASVIDDDCKFESEPWEVYTFTQRCDIDTAFLMDAEDERETSFEEGSSDFELVGPVVVEVGNVYGSGYNDVVLGATGKVLVLEGDGFGDLTPVQEVLVDGQVTDIELVHLNGDSHLDAAITVDGANVLAILLNRGGGGFDDSLPIPTYEVGVEPIAVASAELDGDPAGVVDLVVGCKGPGNLHVFGGLGDGNFELRDKFPVPPRTGRTADLSAIAVADFDGNGRVDVAAATGTMGTVEILLSDTASAILDATWWTGSFETPSGPTIVAIAADDLVGEDGRPDLAVVVNTPDSLESAVLDLWTNVAVGGPFTTTATRPIPLGTSDLPVGIRVGSFLTESGRDIEIAFRNRIAQGLTYPDYDPAAGERVVFEGPTPAVYSMAAGILADTDSSTTLDLVLGGSALAKTVSVLINDGHGYD